MPKVHAHLETLLIADPKILAVPIYENHEPLVNLKDQKLLAFGPSPEIPNNMDYTKIRKRVYQKLLVAQTLLPTGLRFCLYEGYRSLALQKQLFNARYRKVKKMHPNWSHTALFNETIKLVSPATNLDGSSNIPPHSTGGAIDIYLIDNQGHSVPMGIHPKNWISDKTGELSRTKTHSISKEAQKNRQLMSHALTQVGFVNYPFEYWHWSFGDRYWAYQTHHATTQYDAIH